MHEATPAIVKPNLTRSLAQPSNFGPPVVTKLVRGCEIQLAELAAGTQTGLSYFVGVMSGDEHR